MKGGLGLRTWVAEGQECPSSLGRVGTHVHSGGCVIRLVLLGIWSLLLRRHLRRRIDLIQHVDECVLEVALHLVELDDL